MKESISSPPSRSGEGRVAIVFEDAASGMRWPQRCRAPDTCRRFLILAADGADAGATGGRPKCMSGRQLARTGARLAPVTNPWGMQQAEKSIRVRNAGEDLLPRPGSAQRSSASGWATARCRESGVRAARIQAMRAARLFARRSARPSRGWDERDDRGEPALRRLPLLHRCSRRRPLFGANRASPARTAGQHTGRCRVRAREPEAERVCS